VFDMEKKWWLGVLLIVAVIGLVLLGFYVNNLRNPYSDEPSDWIIDKGGGVKEIDVEEVTGGKGRFLQVEEEYIDAEKNIHAAFELSGFYNGVYFLSHYPKTNPEIKISQTMKPYDGIIEGFMIEYIEDGVPYVRIFLDADWERRLDETTNIMWGNESQNIRKFKFKEISKGVYSDIIEDDIERFLYVYDGSVFNSATRGAILVGNMDQSDLGDNGRRDRTFIALT